MQLKVILFCILFAQTSASFFDEFRGAMSSVENSFGKLLTDVVTDVRDTIGCTILAVKQVLALGGIFHESSEYNARCRGITEGPNYVQEKNENYSPTPPLVTTTTARSTFEADSSERSIPEIISEEIDESIKNVNNTLFEFVDKSDTHEKIENVTSSLLNESERLAKISALLRHELEIVSENAKMRIRKTESDVENPNIQDIWEDIKALHNIELHDDNANEAKEIHHILNEVLNVLRGIDNRAPNEIIDKMNLNDTFIQLKNQFLKLEEEESQDINMVEDIVEADLNINRNENKFKPDSFPLTFKDVAKQIMDETSRTLRLSDDFDGHEEPITTTTEASQNSEIVEDDPAESPDYIGLFQIAPKGSYSRTEAVESAKKLIEKSKETEAVMNDYFKKSSEIGTSVFDNPDIFYF